MSGSLSIYSKLSLFPLVSSIRRGASIKISDIEVKKIQENGDAWLLSARQVSSGRIFLRGTRSGKPFKRSMACV